MKEGNDIAAAIKDYPQRSFELKKKLGEGTEGFDYFALSKCWGDKSNQEFKLQFSYKQKVKEEEHNFLKQLMGYQSSKDEEFFPSNMIRILDIFDYQNYLVIVMEKGEQDLKNYLAQKREIMNNIQKTQICQGVIMPIYFLHVKEFIHNDIKPEHYVKVGDKFKLINFGLVKTNSLVQKDYGTMIYSAPEIIENILYFISDKFDIWSLGCLFYEIFSPESLFEGQNFDEVKKQIIHHKNNPKLIYDKIEKLHCYLPIQNVIKQMLQFDQNKRLNIYQVLEQLQYTLPKNLTYQKPIGQIFFQSQSTTNRNFSETQSQFSPYYQIPPFPQTQYIEYQNAQQQRQPNNSRNNNNPQQQQFRPEEKISNQQLSDIEKKIYYKLEQLKQENEMQLKQQEDKIKTLQNQIEQYQKKQEDQQNLQNSLLVDQQIKQSPDLNLQIQQQKGQSKGQVQQNQNNEQQKQELIIKQLSQQQEQFTKNKQEVDKQFAKIQQQIQQISNQLQFTIQKPSEPNTGQEQQNYLFQMEKNKQQSEQYQNQQQDHKNSYDQQIQRLQDCYNKSLAYQQTLYSEIQQMKEDQTNPKAIKKQQQEIQQINSKLDKEIQNRNNELYNQIRKLNLETLKKQIQYLEDKFISLENIFENEIYNMKIIQIDSQLLDLKEFILQQHQLYLTQQEQQNQIKLELNQLNQTLNIHQKKLSIQENTYNQTLESLKMNDQNIIIEKEKAQHLQQINLFVQELCDELKKQIYQDFTLLEQKIEQKVNYTQIQELKDTIIEINKQIKLTQSEILIRKNVEINNQDFLQFNLNKVQQDYQTCQQKLQSQESLISNQNEQIKEFQNITQERQKQLKEQTEQIAKLRLENEQLQEQLQKNIQEKNKVILELYASQQEIQQLKQENQGQKHQIENMKQK